MTNRPNPQPTTLRARMKRRRLGQVRRAKAAYRDRQRERLAQAENARSQQTHPEAPRWRRPDDPLPHDPCGPDYGSRITADPAVPSKARRERRVPAKLRRAVRAQPDNRLHGPNRGGESANSWSRPEDR